MTLEGMLKALHELEQIGKEQMEEDGMGCYPVEIRDEIYRIRMMIKRGDYKI